MPSSAIYVAVSFMMTGTPFEADAGKHTAHNARAQYGCLFCVSNYLWSAFWLYLLHIDR